MCIALIWYIYLPCSRNNSLRASSPIWASETSLARTREGHVFYVLRSFRGGNENLWEIVASSPFLGPSLARSREARFARPNRRACSQARPRMKKRRNRRKETVKICSLSPYIFYSHKYKLKNFCLQACTHQSTVTRGSVVDWLHTRN